ncbi:MAG: hypothetical protein P1U53_13610 [Sulfitobacter sp.]|nr:hypothetical protein [Sulfitobacter sp.]
MKGTPHDPKGLIQEAYRITDITSAECRSIFLDWALSLPIERDTGQTIRALLEVYREEAADHPMTLVLKEGLHGMAAPRRRGGWRSRPRN